MSLRTNPIWLLASLPFFWFACSTAPEDPQASSFATHQATMISIPSVAQYQRLVETQDLEGLATFAGDRFAPLPQPSPEADQQREAQGLPEDDFLFHLLNEDRVVAIDQWVFRMDFATAQVYTMRKENLDYTDLRNGNVENPQLMVFSFEDDVLELLQAGQTQGAARQEWCDGVDATEAKVFWNRNLTTSFRTRNTDCKYFKGGIYFSMTVRLQVQEKVRNNFWGTDEWKTINVYLRADFPNYLRKKCSTLICQSDGKMIETYGDKASKTFYSSINKLSDIEVSVRYFVNSSEYGSFTSPWLIIDTHHSTSLENQCD